MENNNIFKMLGSADFSQEKSEKLIAAGYRRIARIGSTSYEKDIGNYNFVRVYPKAADDYTIEVIYRANCDLNKSIATPIKEIPAELKIADKILANKETKKK